MKVQTFHEFLQAPFGAADTAPTVDVDAFDVDGMKSVQDDLASINHALLVMQLPNASTLVPRVVVNGREVSDPDVLRALQVALTRRLHMYHIQFDAQASRSRC